MRSYWNFVLCNLFRFTKSVLVAQRESYQGRLINSFECYIPFVVPFDTENIGFIFFINIV